MEQGDWAGLELYQIPTDHNSCMGGESLDDERLDRLID
jgi:hypothetical protein